MSLRSRSVEVQQVFKELDAQNSAIQKQSKLQCFNACGKCCHNPKIVAYPIEFLPFAIHLLETNQIHQFLEILEKSESELCPIYSPSTTQWSCTQYEHRGLICRIFGFGAQRNKEGKARLITCKLLKEGRPNEVKAAEEAFLDNDFEYASTYYDRIKGILPSLSEELLPIKEAIRTVIEYTLQTSYYESLSDDQITDEDGLKSA